MARCRQKFDSAMGVVPAQWRDVRFGHAGVSPSVVKVRVASRAYWWLLGGRAVGVRRVCDGRAAGGDGAIVVPEPVRSRCQARSGMNSRPWPRISSCRSWR